MFHDYCKWPAALLLIVLPFVDLAGQTDQPSPVLTYRSVSSEVRIMFFPTDARNRALATVTENDFVVIDGDMVVRHFRSLLRTDENVLDVVILIDASESVAKDFSAVINEVLELISQRPIAEDGDLSVIAFSGLQLAVICIGDCRTPAAKQRILSLKPAGATPLFDALLYAANLISQRSLPGVRPVLILFSDGDDTISKASGEDALQAVIDSGALIYGVDVSSVDSSGGSAALRRMAEASGGRTFSASEGTGVLQGALADLRNSYVVTYQPPTSVVGFHSLRILPKYDPNLRFHCRSGYYYGENQ